MLLKENCSLKVKICIFVLSFIVFVNGAFAKIIIIENVPYINQVEDVDKSKILGHNACASAVAVMLLTYYGILPKHKKYPGYYIYSPYVGFRDEKGNDYSEKFAYDSDGINGGSNKVYGVHGYVTGEYGGSWQADIGNVINYLENHCLETEENSSKNIFEKIKQNIDNGYPQIVRAKIDGNGHYLLVVGYDDEREKIIVHDPYGDANKNWLNVKAGGKYISYPLDNNTASWAYVKISSVLIVKPKK